MAIHDGRMPGKLRIDLSGPEGNCYVLLGYARKLSRQLGRNWDKIRTEMISDGYDHLLETFDKEFGEYVDMYRGGTGAELRTSQASAVPSERCGSDEADLFDPGDD